MKFLFPGRSRWQIFQCLLHNPLFSGHRIWGIMDKVSPIISSPKPAGHASALPAPGFPWLPDQGDGTFRNPVICADYSDPDVVRVGDDFYLTASSFNCTPGLPISDSPSRRAQP